MNLRDRQWATLIIWGVFIFLTFLVVDRMLIIPTDFTGLWPHPANSYSIAQDAEQLNQILINARASSAALMAEVDETIRTQLAIRVPLALILSAMLMLSATLCTFFIWRNAGLEMVLAREAVQAEKIKRRSRVEQLVDDLDADEMIQLRSRLSGENDIQARL